MSHRIEFDTTDRIVLLTFLDIVTEDSILAGIAAVQEVLRSNSAEGTILDFSGIEQFCVSASFFQNFVNTRRKLVAPDKPRIVVAPQAVVFGMLRMLQAHSEADGTAPKVVRTMAEAYEFLKLKAPSPGSQACSSASAGGAGGTGD